MPAAPSPHSAAAAWNGGRAMALVRCVRPVARGGPGECPHLSPQERAEAAARIDGTACAGRGPMGRGRPWRRLAFVTLALTVALAACGKRNAPVPPPGEPSTYPRSYPSE